MAHGTPLLVYPKLRSRQAAGKGFILLHPELPVWVTCNRTAIEIYRSLARGSSIPESATSLSRQYHISEETAFRDVTETSKMLTEAGFLEKPVVAGIQKPSLESLFLHLTNHCNLSCLHCYVKSMGIEGTLPFPTATRLIDELIDLGGTRVVLSGGEPLLYDDIRNLIEHAAKRLTIMLLTNGTLLDADFSQFLASESDSSVQISIDGSKPETHDLIRGAGSFTRALEAVDCLQRAGLGAKIIFAATIMKPNIHELDEIVRLAGRIGVPRVRFISLKRAGCSDRRWSTIGSSIDHTDHESLFEKFSFGTGDTDPTVDVTCGLSGLLISRPDPESVNTPWCPVGREIVVTPDGAAYPCSLMLNPEFKLGNVHRSNLDDILNGDEMNGLRRVLVERKLKIKECAACLWRNFCRGGCMADAFESKGTLLETDVHCEYRKKAYGRIFDIFIKDYEERQVV